MTVVLNRWNRQFVVFFFLPIKHLGMRKKAKEQSIKIDILDNSYSHGVNLDTSVATSYSV